MANFLPKMGEKINKEQLEGYKLIGDGADGEIYQLTDHTCMKLFFKEETKKRELEALEMGQSSNVIPRLYEHGVNFIEMEYVKGISLSKKLKKEKKIEKELSEKILLMLDELKRIGFTRYDAEVRHILINEEGNLKVIDHKRALSSKQSIPIKLLKGLKKRHVLEQFLNHVSELRPDLYNKWVK
ncbi:MAG TPA: kinase [Bacilli bacterium]|nr:kinase [Bacilli bacterium]